MRCGFRRETGTLISAALGTGSCFNAAAWNPALVTIGRAAPQPPRLVIAIDNFEDLASPRRKLGGVVGRLHNRPPRIRREIARRHPARALNGRDEDERGPISIPTTDCHDIARRRRQRRALGDRVSLCCQNERHGRTRSQSNSGKPAEPARSVHPSIRACRDPCRVAFPLYLLTCREPGSSGDIPARSPKKGLATSER